MIPIATGEDAVEAWRDACEQLLLARGGELHDLVVKISGPTRIQDDWFHRFDPIAAGGNDRLSNVANTIFPLKSWENTRSRDREEFYQRYKAANRRSGHRRWGTYFGRLIDFGDSHVNQLENAISKIRSWRNIPRSAICLHTTSAETDSIKPLGSPCLQTIQFHCHPDVIDFSVLYRNHDYFEKALGNFVGLGRLLEFVAGECDRQPGRLVCFSTHAYTSGGKRRLRALTIR